MTVLRGPADADHFRVKVGRYNDRWYYDSLPSCPIAGAWDWQGPSWSIVKSAAGKDWSFVTNKRNGHTPQAELERIAKLEPDERTKAFNGINAKGLKQAGGRGTIVHLWAEDLLAGRAPREITSPMLFTMKLPAAAADEAEQYLPALEAFFDHYQPEVIAAEYVALHRTLNGHGYGCTPDVIARIQGQTLGIDWKTRGIDSDHGAYPEEAAQIAAGANAEYIIIQGTDGTPQRALLPKIDGGIVVSIRPDGCRVYPVDLEPAWGHVQAMHAFWVARLTEKAAIGKPWPPTPISDAARIPVSDATGAVPITAALISAAPAPVAQPLEEDPWTTTTSKPSNSSGPTTTTDTSPTTTKKPTTKRSTPPTTSGTTRGTTPDEPATTSPPTTTAPTASSTTHAYTSTVLAEAMTSWPAAVQAELAEWWPILTPTPDAVRNGEAIWTEAEIDHIEKMCDLANAPFWQTAATQTRAR